MKAVYKCRLCGEQFSTAQAGEETATRCIELLPFNVLDSEIQPPVAIITAHNCGGDHTGSLGLADFLGWKKEGAENWIEK